MIGRLLAAISLYAFLFILAEVLYRRGLRAPVTRKLAHIGGGLISFALPLFLDLRSVVFLGVLFTLILFVSQRLRLLPGIHLGNAGGYGAILYPLGLTISALLFWAHDSLAFQASALVLGVSDGMSALVGWRFGKRSYNITGRKTFEGSLAFFLATIVVFLFLLFYSHLPLNEGTLLTVIGGSILLTLVEALLGKGLDNLALPILGGAVVLWL